VTLSLNELFSPRVLDKNPQHDLSCGGEKTAAAIPVLNSPNQTHLRTLARERKTANR
jgi:hypothetical protein